MMQYINNLEERLKDSIAMEIQRLKEEMNMTTLAKKPRPQGIKKKIDDKSHLSTTPYYGHHPLSTSII